MNIKYSLYPLNRKAYNNSGYSLIEFALTFVLTVPVIILSLDLTKIMQAKSVANSATNKAVRCLTVTDDPRCSEVKPSNARAVYRPRLNISNQLNIPQVSYDAEVKYLEAPSYELGPFNAQVLESVTESISGGLSLMAEIPLYSAQTEVTYHMLDSKRVPSITAGDARNPVFENGYTIVSFSGQANSSSFINNGPTTGVSYSSEFSVPEIFINSTCLGAGSYSMTSGDTACLDRNQQIRAILWVKGQGSSQVFNSSTAACAKALLSLEESDLNSNKFKTVKELSGQSYWGDGGNFLPRGYELSESSYINKDVIPVKYADSNLKTEAFAGEIKFSANKKYRVAVRVEPNYELKNIKCIPGDAYYKVSGGNLYFPKIRKVTESVRCENSVSSCSTVKQCKVSSLKNSGIQLNQATFEKIASKAPEKISDIISRSTVSCNKSIANHESLVLVSKSLLNNSECSCSDSRLFADPSPSLNKKYSALCPENYGVSDGNVSDNLLTDSVQAQNICPQDSVISFDFGHPDKSQIARSWSLKTVRLADTLSVSANNCQQANPTDAINKAWTDNFPLYRYPLKNQTLLKDISKRRLIQTGKESQSFPQYDPNDPDQLIKNISYNCQQFSVRKFRPSELEKIVPANPVFFDNPSKAHDNCFASRDSDYWKKMLVSEIRRNYQNTEDAFISPSYIIRGSRTTGCEKPAENNECISYAYQDPADLKSVLLDEISDPTKLPEQCHKRCANCTMELKEFTESITANTELKLQAAKNIAYEELNTFSPWLSRDCGEKHCAQIQADHSDISAEVRANISVPLFSKEIFNILSFKSDAKSHLTVSSSARRMMEREIAIR